MSVIYSSIAFAAVNDPKDNGNQQSIIDGSQQLSAMRYVVSQPDFRPDIRYVQ